MTKLTPLQIQLAEQLLISVAKKEPVIEYNEIAERVTPKIKNPRNVGKEIGQVSKLCYELDLPLISAKVVSKGTMSAGTGFYEFYKMFGIDTAGYSEKELFRLELKKIRECTEWYRLAEHLSLTIDGLNKPSIEKQIRILPMSKTLEFKDYTRETVQQKFFLGDLINIQKGLYYFREVGMNCGEGSFILFQFDNQIVASATLKRIHKYQSPIDNIYEGAFEFYTDTIEVFEPIEVDELGNIVSHITRFSQVKQEINWDKLQDIKNLISQKKMLIYPDDIAVKGQIAYIEGAKKEITVNAYERKPVARRECIKTCGCRCIICGFDFGVVYGEQFTGKIHVHHKNPLYLVDKEYELNPAEDLAPVCPNCHMILHAKEDGVYTVEEVTAFIAANASSVDRA